MSEPKVLYVGVFRDPTGWGQSACDYIRALDAAGVQVVPRPLRLAQQGGPIHARIAELEKQSAYGCTHVIQHVLPHQFDYSGRLKNIGLFFTETTNFRASLWPERINMMDRAWVANRQQVNACRYSHVTVPVDVVPLPTDISRFQRGYQPLPELKTQLDGNFAFYTIGELTRRKNIAALLMAFHTEFRPSEPVSLVIKASLPGASEEETAKHVDAMTNEIKRGLKLYVDNSHYSREIVITRRLTDEAMMRLHHTCDCFVQPSYGEAWSIPAFDAMACGKTPIVTACTGYLDYMTRDTGFLVPAKRTPVFGVQDTFRDLFTGNEDWWTVSIPALRLAMRQVYECAEVRRQHAEAGIERAYDFTYEKVGALMKQKLREA